MNKYVSAVSKLNDIHDVCVLLIVVQLKQTNIHTSWVYLLQTCVRFHVYKYKQWQTGMIALANVFTPKCFVHDTHTHTHIAINSVVNFHKRTRSVWPSRLISIATTLMAMRLIASQRTPAHYNYIPKHNLSAWKLYSNVRYAFLLYNY